MAKTFNFRQTVSNKENGNHGFNFLFRSMFGMPKTLIALIHTRNKAPFVYWWTLQEDMLLYLHLYISELLLLFTPRPLPPGPLRKIGVLWQYCGSVYILFIHCWTIRRTNFVNKTVGCCKRTSKKKCFTFRHKCDAF